MTGLTKVIREIKRSFLTRSGEKEPRAQPGREQVSLGCWSHGERPAGLPKALKRVSFLSQPTHSAGLMPSVCPHDINAKTSFPRWAYRSPPGCSPRCTPGCLEQVPQAPMSQLTGLQSLSASPSRLRTNHTRHLFLLEGRGPGAEATPSTDQSL